MQGSKAEIIAALQKQLLPVQGGKPLLNGIPVDAPPGPKKIYFPNNILAFGSMHEFLTSSPENRAATHGFIAALLNTLMENGGVSLWISSSKNIFPPALAQFGIAPENIIFLTLQKEKEMLWAFEEALKYKGLAAVIGELNQLSFSISRRLQLAVESSGLMAFVIRKEQPSLHTTACVSRWRIKHLASALLSPMPGVGFASWKAELLKIRNGKPFTWQVEWTAGKFRMLPLVQTEKTEKLLQTG